MSLPARVARPTMKDVAAEAAVSLKTVSRALGNEPGVRTATRERVVAAANRLGFRRNDLAASLRRLDRSMATVGLVIEDLGNPFYASVMRGVEAEMRARGHVLLVASSEEDSTLEREIVDTFLSRRVDGLIVVPASRDQSYLARDRAAGVAVVYLDRPPEPLVADCVLADNATGATEAVGHLLELGHRRIGYVGDADTLFTMQERYGGYRSALVAAGIALDEQIVRHGAADVVRAEAAVAELLAVASPPTAIFAGNNRCTVGAVRALHGRRPAFGLVGYDDFELADLLDPPVTVIANDARALGRVAAQRLLARLDGDERSPRRIVLPTKLIVRD
ncbi:MAG: LacI family DNA-binding transcriptional regulator [Mycobacteriales bacterium]